MVIGKGRIIGLLVLLICPYGMNTKLKLFPNHLVETSPWPISTALSLYIFMNSIVLVLQGGSNIPLVIALLALVSSMTLWWKDVIIESTYQGHHTSTVVNGIRMGFMLFIITELFLFVTIFWTQLHSALVPDIQLGSIWPPMGIEGMNPFGIPLLNTFLLLSSGASVTWAHYSLLNSNKNETIISLALTIIYATVFTLLQIYEYYYASFTFVDAVYGCTFYSATGLHALHVMIGNIFLIIAFIRIIKNHFTDTHHLGFELGIIYWHFVDLVWLALFIVFYYWGS